MSNPFPIPVRYPGGMNEEHYSPIPTGIKNRRPSLPHLPHINSEVPPPLTLDTAAPCHRRADSDGSIDIPRNYSIPTSPLTVFQHIRRSSSLGSSDYTSTPSRRGSDGEGSVSSRSGSVSSGSIESATTPPSQQELSSSPPTYFWTQFSPATNPASVAALKRAQSLGASYHTCGDTCFCSHHHHRRNSVAIKFSPTYLEDPFYEDEVTKTDRRGQTEMEARNAAYGRAARRHSTSTLHRPPTPIAERILKGDFTF